jgi:hypothetical protein
LRLLIIRFRSRINIRKGGDRILMDGSTFPSRLSADPLAKIRADIFSRSSRARYGGRRRYTNSGNSWRLIRIFIQRCSNDKWP